MLQRYKKKKAEKPLRICCSHLSHIFSPEIKEKPEAFSQRENRFAYNFFSFHYFQFSMFIDKSSESQFNAENWRHESSRKKAFNRLASTQRKAENDSIKFRLNEIGLRVDSKRIDVQHSTKCPFQLNPQRRRSNTWNVAWSDLFTRISHTQSNTIEHIFVTKVLSKHQ